MSKLINYNLNNYVTIVCSMCVVSTKYPYNVCIYMYVYYYKLILI